MRNLASSPTHSSLSPAFLNGAKYLKSNVFNQHAEHVSELFDQHHLFADDMQCHCSGIPAEAALMASRLERCIADVSAW